MTNDTQKAQAALIKSMMGNPKIAKIIHEAVNAPIGSTKRDRARATISVIKKTSPYRGQGGFSDFLGSVKSSISSLFGSTPAPAPKTTPSVSYPMTPMPTSKTPSIGSFTPMPSGAIILPSVPNFNTSKLTVSSSTLPKNVNTFTATKTSPVTTAPVGPKTYSDSSNFSFSPTGNTSKTMTSPAPVFNTQTSTPSVEKKKEPNLAPLKSVYEWPETTKATAPKGMAPSELAQTYHKVRDSVVSNVVNPLLRPWGLLTEGVTGIGGDILKAIAKEAKGAWGAAKEATEGIRGGIFDIAAQKYIDPRTGMPMYSEDVKRTLAGDPSAKPTATTGATKTGQPTGGVKEEKKTVLPDGSVVTETREQKGQPSQIGPQFPAAFEGFTDEEKAFLSQAKDQTTPAYGMSKAGLVKWAEESPNEFLDWASKNGLTGQVSSSQSMTSSGTYSNTSPSTGTTGFQSAGTTTGTPTGSASQGIRDMLFNQLPAGTVQGGADADTLMALAPAGTKPEDLPVGRTIQEQLLWLQNSLDDYYNVQEAREARDAMSATPAQAKQTMIDFVKSRDEYLAHIQKLKDDANNRFNSSDMSDPMNVNAYKQYSSFLDRLKMSHNDRYATYLNKSLDRYQDELKQVDDAYKTAVASSEAAFKTRGGMLKDIYDDQYKMLTDLNKMLDEAPEKQLRLEKARIDLQRAYLGLAKDANESKSEGKIIQNMSNIGKYLGVTDGNDKGALRTDIDLSAEIPWLIDQGEDPEAVLGYVGWGGKSRIGYASNNGYSPAIKESKGIINNLFKLATAEDLGGDYTNPEKAAWWQDTARKTGEDILNTSGEAISSYVLNKIKDGADAKALLTDLGPREGWFGRVKDPYTRDEYINRHSGDFDESLLNSIYDSYEVTNRMAPGKNIANSINSTINTRVNAGEQQSNVIAGLIRDSALSAERLLLAQLM